MFEFRIFYNFQIQKRIVSFWKLFAEIQYMFVSLQLGQLIVFKGMLIGIYKSPDLFNRKHFGLVFSKNFTQTQIQQKIEDKDPMETDDSRRSFHTAITY